jgi:cell division protein FtsA
MMDYGEIVVGLDLGTTKICALIAEISVEEGIKVIGVGSYPSEGLRRGVVVDVEKTIQSIGKVIKEAELMAGVQVESVYVGVAGEHIGSVNSRGVIGVAGSNREISLADKEKVIEAARAVAIPFDREVLHVLPQEFIVDDQRGIRDPAGMSGVRLETTVHIVTGAVTSVQNICKSVQRSHIAVRDVVLEPLASAKAVLHEDEREMGVCLVDIGGGTTDVAIFQEGSVRHTAVIGVGGQNVTSDIAIVLRTSWAHAEKIKFENGTAWLDGAETVEDVEVPGVAGRRPQMVSRRELGAIIEARMEEVFVLVGEQIQRSGYTELLGAGVVLTGGGALLDGAAELAERLLGLPVRLGAPKAGGGMGEGIASPIYATAMGLVLFGAESGAADGWSARRSKGLSEGRFDTVMSRMTDWLKTLV